MPHTCARLQFTAESNTITETLGRYQTRRIFPQEQAHERGKTDTSHYVGDAGRKL